MSRNLWQKQMPDYKHGSERVGNSRTLNELPGSNARMLVFLVFFVPFVVQNDSTVVLIALGNEPHQGIAIAVRSSNLPFTDTNVHIRLLATLHFF